MAEICAAPGVEHVLPPAKLREFAAHFQLGNPPRPLQFPRVPPGMSIV